MIFVSYLKIISFMSEKMFCFAVFVPCPKDVLILLVAKSKTLFSSCKLRKLSALKLKQTELAKTYFLVS